MTVVSLEQRYAGHAPQALALAAQVPGGAYYAKWIVAVDHDVDPSNINQVLWAMATRCNPVDDIDILRNTWSTWLDPTQNPPAKRPYGSKALINACMDHRHITEFSRRTRVRRAVYDSVAARGGASRPPAVAAVAVKPYRQSARADGVVRFAGEAVAVAVAADAYHASDAAAAVDVEYEVLPAATDPERALEPGAPLVHAEWRDNVAATVTLGHGDVTAALARARLVVTRRLRFRRLTAPPLEAPAL